MPGKIKTRKENDSAYGLWVAPRRAPQRPHQISPRTYEPVSGSSLNRYLEFADIALGLNESGSRKEKATKTGHKPDGEKPGPKLVSISSGGKRGFGAFRNSR